MSRSQKITIIILSIVLVFLVLALVCLLTRNDEFVAPSFDADAKNMPDKFPDSYTLSENEQYFFTFGLCAEIRENNGSSEIFFTSPSSNAAYLKLRILKGEDDILYESGLIRPSECIESIPLSLEKYADEKIYAKIMAYEINTYHSLGSCVVKLNVKK